MLAKSVYVFRSMTPCWGCLVFTCPAVLRCVRRALQAALRGCRAPQRPEKEES